jgi:hypothetical protein
MHSNEIILTFKVGDKRLPTRDLRLAREFAEAQKSPRYTEALREQVARQTAR